MAAGRKNINFSWLDELREWCLTDREGQLRDGHDRHYTLFVALLRPDGRPIAAFPGWSIGDDSDEEKFRAEIYKWVDAVLDKRFQADSELILDDDQG